MTHEHTHQILYLIIKIHQMLAWLQKTNTWKYIYIYLHIYEYLCKYITKFQDTNFNLHCNFRFHSSLFAFHIIISSSKISLFYRHVSHYQHLLFLPSLNTHLPLSSTSFPSPLGPVTSLLYSYCPLPVGERGDVLKVACRTSAPTSGFNSRLITSVTTMRGSAPS